MRGKKVKAIKEKMKEKGFDPKVHKALYRRMKRKLK